MLFVGLEKKPDEYVTYIMPHKKHFTIVSTLITILVRFAHEIIVENEVKLLFIYSSSRVEDYGHRTPQDPTGKKRKHHQILQETTGNHRYGSSIPTGNFLDFFPANFYRYPAFSDRNRSRFQWKKSEKFRWEYCFHEIIGMIRNRPFPCRTV